MQDSLFNRPQGEPEPSSDPVFPPLTKSHILNCSFHSWHERYRSITPKARLIPLTPAFLTYLRADGIIIPPDQPVAHEWSDGDSGIFSAAEGEGDDDADDEDDESDPSRQWPEVHERVRATIEELGGNVVPKLNWSAPKDATWINATNSMECRSPGDVYLLLKSSDFVTHDLECVFDGCVDDDDTEEESAAGTQSQEQKGVDDDLETTTTALSSLSLSTIPYHLVLRKTVLQLNPALEFRCFVRDRGLIGICQREQNHFDFLFPHRDKFRSLIQLFFDTRLRDTFPDPSFAFDVYIPPPHKRVWLIDINPWAPRTDPLLFEWMELLTMPGPESWDEDDAVLVKEEHKIKKEKARKENGGAGADTDSETEIEEISRYLPEFRLIKRDDPEAYSFATRKYGAHKLPLEVVAACSGGEGQLEDFASKWKEIVQKRQVDDEASSDEEA